MACSLWGDLASRPPRGRRPLLSAREEAALGWRVRAGDREARDRLILSNRRLVWWVAVRYLRRGMGPQADVLGWGSVGLVRAADAYDPAWQVRFSTFAVPCIRNAILMGWREGGRLIRIPPINGDGPKGPEIRRLRRSATRFEPLPGDLGPCRVGPEPPPDPAEVVAGEDEAAARRARLDAAMGFFLDPRAAAVLRWRYELDGPGPRTLMEVGGELGLSRERVRQIEIRALDRLSKAVMSSG